MSFRSLSYKNFIKDEMTGRVSILWRIFENCKKVKITITGLEGVKKMFNQDEGKIECAV